MRLLPEHYERSSRKNLIAENRRPKYAGQEGCRARTRSIDMALAMRRRAILRNGRNSDGKPLTYTQREKLQKEEEEYQKMFELFDGKAEIEFLDSEHDDKLAACAYGDAFKRSKPKSQASWLKDDDDLNGSASSISGYNFNSLLKDDDNESSTNSFAEDT